MLGAEQCSCRGVEAGVIKLALAQRVEHSVWYVMVNDGVQVKQWLPCQCVEVVQYTSSRCIPAL